jgi:metallo-beta-lactamase family protein
MVTITCLGATGSVTGSNFLVETPGGKKLMVDCGLFQGNKEMESRNWGDWGYNPREVKLLVLTHAHIDHSGRIPKLVKDGFRGKIIASPPTVDLCEVMLLDSAHVQEMEAEWRTKKNKRKAKHRVLPLYTTLDAEDSLQYFCGTEMDKIVEPEPGVKVRLRDSGHILGASIVELWIEEDQKNTKIVFSGDLGRQDALIVKDPVPVEEADYLFVESTYGDRLHRTFEESKAELLEAIEYAYAHQEKVIIPAFAVERTQEILYILGEFSRSGQLPDIPVFLDSPLAIKATEIFRKNKAYYDEDARDLVRQGVDPFDMPNLKFTVTAKESMEINQLNGSAIVVSANGMCNAGRIKHHLKHNLWRPGASIVITGFQSQGTTGRQIVDGAERVTIFGEKIAVRARVFTIGGISAHGDQADLLRWIGHFTQKSRPQIFVIHGELLTSQTFAKAIRETWNLDVIVPRWREVLRLVPRERIKEIPVGVDREILRRNLLEMTANLEAVVSRLKEQIAKDEKQFVETDVEKLFAISGELNALISG